MVFSILEIEKTTSQLAFTQSILYYLYLSLPLNPLIHLFPYPLIHLNTQQFLLLTFFLTV